MAATSNTLNYASPPRPKTEHRSPTARVFATAAVLAVLYTLSERSGGGSDGFHLRDERMYGCMVSIGCVVAYAVSRVWSDPPVRVVRAVIFTCAVITSTLAYFAAHITSLHDPVPALSYQSDFWRCMAAFILAPVIASSYVGLEAVVGRGGPSAHRPAG